MELKTTENGLDGSQLTSTSLEQRNLFLRVLHVDDDETQLDMLRLFINRLDGSMEVVSCIDPLEAVKLVSGNGFDCVISDYVMPEINGVELVRRIKELKDIPFILYTGQGSEEVAQLAFQAGVDDYIRKEIEPSHYEVLINSVRHAVDKHRAEEIYRVVFESNPEAIIVTIDEIIEYSNLASISLFGIEDRQELVGRRFTDFLLDNESDEVSWVSLQRIVSDNRVIPFELSLRASDSQLKLVEGAVQNMYFFGKPAQFYFLKDISERREMERGLMHTQHQFDRIFNHSLIGIALLDKGLKIERCNTLFLKIFGLTPDSASFLLFEEPRFYSKIHGRLLPSDSVPFDLVIDFKEMKKQGYIDTTRRDKGRIELIVSPVSLEKNGSGYLVQARESDSSLKS